MNRFSLALFFLLTIPACVRAQTPVQEIKAGKTALKNDDFPNAERYFSRALQHPDNSTILNVIAFHGRGWARLQLHRWSDAKDDLTHAVELDPTDAGAFAARGMARKAMGDYEGLLLDADRAAKISPTKYASFQDDAKSTVLYRRVLLGFLVLAGILMCVAMVPLGQTLFRISRAGG